MTIENAYPIVKVVYGEKQYVWLVSCSAGCVWEQAADTGSKKQCNVDGEFHGRVFLWLLAVRPDGRGVNY